MTNYFYEFSLLYGFCGICYLLIQRFTSFRSLRGFLLFSLLLSLVLPQLPTLFHQSVQGLSIQLPMVLVGDLGQIQAENIPDSFHWLNLFTFSNLIVFVSGILLVRLLYNFAKLIRIVSRSTIIQKDGHSLVYSDEVKNPCSFFRYILLPVPMNLTDEELEVVIKHENLHIKFLHSFERLLFEVAHIIIWWHPVHFLFRRKLALLHEYEVDQAMLNHVKANNYKEILLQLIINPPGLRMTNPFSSNIKKRIFMLNNRKKESSKVILPMVGVFMVSTMLMIHSCTTQEVELPSQDKLTTEITNSYTTTVTDTIVVFDFDTKKEEISIVNNTIEVFKSPDVMPLFPGCTGTDDIALKECSQKKLLQFVYRNIEYPSSARENNIEGIVVVKFVVGSDGEILTTEIVRTPGYGLSESVNDMMVKMEEEILWIPGRHEGKNVHVQYVLPVKFKLEG